VKVRKSDNIAEKIALRGSVCTLLYISNICVDAKNILSVRIFCFEVEDSFSHSRPFSSRFCCDSLHRSNTFSIQKNTIHFLFPIVLYHQFFILLPTNDHLASFFDYKSFVAPILLVLSRETSVTEIEKQYENK